MTRAPDPWELSGTGRPRLQEEVLPGREPPLTRFPMPRRPPSRREEGRGRERPQLSDQRAHQGSQAEEDREEAGGSRVEVVDGSRVEAEGSRVEMVETVAPVPGRSSRPVSTSVLASAPASLGPVWPAAPRGAASSLLDIEYTSMQFPRTYSPCREGS